VVFDGVKRIFLRAFDRRRSIRLLGVGLTQFSAAGEETMSMFAADVKREQALSAVDRLKKKFGDDSIHTGAI